MNSFSRLASNGGSHHNDLSNSTQIYSINQNINNNHHHLYNNTINNNNNNHHHTHLNGTTSSGGSSSGYDTLSMSQPQPFNYGTDIYGTNSSFKLMSMMNNGHSGSMGSGDENMFSQMGGDQLNSLMNDAVIAMDLPPDKLKIVKMLPDDKKIQFLISLRYVSEKQPPEYYTNALKTYIDGMSNSKSTLRRPKLTPTETSTALIKNLEVSLRTNRIDWVHKFLDGPLNGLDVLIAYLENSLNLMREYEQFNLDFVIDSYQSPVINAGLSSQSHSNMLTLPSSSNKSQSISVAASLERRASRAHKDTRKRMLKLNMGEAIDDVHECVRCLRAIMNHQYGFHMIIGHKDAINSIALSLKHKEYRTKSLVLELLAAVCLVDGGHSIVLRAFDNFKDVYKETYRFETLMNYFRKDANEPDFNIDFMVACMQFINIIVHSTQQMNFRVHLQYEFTQLGLDEYLENKLRYNESDRLQVQIQAYLDNQFDVQQLLEDADAKNETLIELEKMRDELSIEKERFNKAQDDALNKISELQNELCQVRSHLDTVAREKEDIFIQMDTLKRNTQMQQQNYSYQNRQNNENMLHNNSQIPPSNIAQLPIPIPPPPPPPPQMFNGLVPPPPPPPPPPMMAFNSKSGGVIPPPPGMAEPPVPTMTIKKKIETKYRLPNLNWVALKPQQVKGTVFCELDDEKLLKVIDFDTFEELFKTGPGQGIVNSNFKTDSPTTLKKVQKKNETLLEAQRQRNLAISRRKIEMGMNELTRAINNLDLNSLPIDQVDILQHFIPTEQEVKSFTSYIHSGKDIHKLSEEDQILISLSKVERLSSKLNIMSFVANFSDTYKNLLPQINAVSSASLSIKQSKKLKKILEVVLAFGNYMNSSKRGPVYGFKLQSLESLLETKTHDKKQTLLHFIVQTVVEKFPDVTNFETELTFIDKAAMVSLENVQFDMNELEKGMRNTRKEYEIRMEAKTVDTHNLKEFLQKAEQQFSELTNKYKTSQEQFHQCVEYFGEAPRSQSPTAFFSTFVKFLKAFNQARLENEQRIKIQESDAAAAAAANAYNNSNSSPQINHNPRHTNGRPHGNGTTNEMIKELKKRNPQNGQNGLLNTSNGNSNGNMGARVRPQVKKEINIEDLIEEINRGYITADAERRKRQRTQEIKKEFVKTSPIQII